jgi:hypothetical protein
VPSTSRSGSEVCGMHGAAGGAPKGNKNALKHGAHSAEALILKRQIAALARLAMRNGSRLLGEFPSPVVRVDRERCGRAGSYRPDGLVARYSDFLTP